MYGGGRSSDTLTLPAQSAWTVSRLTREIRQVLQATIGEVWVEGEISNFSRSGAGHLYFTLKDEQAQIRAVVWQSQAANIPFQIADGLRVLVFGAIDVYGGRGQYQLVLRQVVPKGIGPLELAFRQLRSRLEAEGLFRPERKRPIPRYPSRIALITSPIGAAVRDFLEVACRRWSGFEVVVLPVTVQGETAAAELIGALRAAQLLDIDLIAVVRGGGSLEDLWPFNDETLARAIGACRWPVVTGIGHEVDVTIADLVADLRALTPSEAAERIFPDCCLVQSAMSQLSVRLVNALRGSIERRRRSLERLEQCSTLQRPTDGLNDRRRDVDDLERRLCQAVMQRTTRFKELLSARSQTLDVLSPLRVLDRGYSLTTTVPERELIRRVTQMQAGDTIEVRVSDGAATCSVTEVKPNHG